MSWSSSRSWIGCAPGTGSSGTSGSVGSLTSSAAESMRTPAAPRSNQKRRIASCSARTSGWSQLRSGCSAVKRCRYHSPGVPSGFVVRVQVVPPWNSEASRSAARRRSRPGPGGTRSARAPGAGAGRERRLEPGVPVGDVVRDDVDDRPDAEREGIGDEGLGLGERAEGRIDGPVVGDVVAAVGQRGDVPRREPDRVDAEVAKVGEPRRGRRRGRRCRRRSPSAKLRSRPRR